MIPSLTQQRFITKKRAAGSKSDRGRPNTLCAEETCVPPPPRPSSPYGHCHSRVLFTSRIPPEPYRTFVAETTDGPSSGPPD